MAKVKTTTKQEKSFAYIKYEGKSVKEGLDARKSGEALVGIDDMLRYFLSQEDPEIKAMNLKSQFASEKVVGKQFFKKTLTDYLLKVFASGSRQLCKRSAWRNGENDFSEWI